MLSAQTIGRKLASLPKSKTMQKSTFNTKRNYASWSDLKQIAGSDELKKLSLDPKFREILSRHVQSTETFGVRPTVSQATDTADYHFTTDPIVASVAEKANLVNELLDATSEPTSYLAMKINNEFPEIRRRQKADPELSVFEAREAILAEANKKKLDERRASFQAMKNRTLDSIKRQQEIDAELDRAFKEDAEMAELVQLLGTRAREAEAKDTKFLAEVEKTLSTLPQTNPETEALWAKLEEPYLKFLSDFDDAETFVEIYAELHPDDAESFVGWVAANKTLELEESEIEDLLDNAIDPDWDVRDVAITNNYELLGRLGNWLEEFQTQNAILEEEGEELSEEQIDKLVEEADKAFTDFETAVKSKNIAALKSLTKQYTMIDEALVDRLTDADFQVFIEDPENVEDWEQVQGVVQKLVDNQSLELWTKAVAAGDVAAASKILEQNGFTPVLLNNLNAEDIKGIEGDFDSVIVEVGERLGNKILNGGNFENFKEAMIDLELIDNYSLDTLTDAEWKSVPKPLTQAIVYIEDLAEAKAYAGYQSGVKNGDVAAVKQLLIARSVVDEDEAAEINADDLKDLQTEFGADLSKTNAANLEAEVRGWFESEDEEEN